MKKLFLTILTGLLLVNTNAQVLQDAGDPVKTPPSVKTVPGATCHWSYGIQCTNKTSNGRRYYEIHFSLAQIDSTGYPIDYPTGMVKIDNAKITCSFTLGGKKYSIPFLPEGNEWVAKFYIQTYRVVPVIFTTEYFNQKSIMTEATLNGGRYPGEGR